VSEDEDDPSSHDPNSHSSVPHSANLSRQNSTTERNPNYSSPPGGSPVAFNDPPFALVTPLSLTSPDEPSFDDSRFPKAKAQMSSPLIKPNLGLNMSEDARMGLNIDVAGDFNTTQDVNERDSMIAIRDIHQISDSAWNDTTVKENKDFGEWGRQQLRNIKSSSRRLSDGAYVKIHRGYIQYAKKHEAILKNVRKHERRRTAEDIEVMGIRRGSLSHVVGIEKLTNSELARIAKGMRLRKAHVNNKYRLLREELTNLACQNQKRSLNSWNQKLKSASRSLNFYDSGHATINKTKDSTVDFTHLSR
jgi:hypothetical protein